MNAKQTAARKAVEFVQEGMVVGLGTGSTAYWAIQRLGQRVKYGLRIRAIATSLRSETLARELDIPIISFADVQSIDLSIDGADEVDPVNNLVKGGGGSLLREKIVAAASRTFIVVVDEGKLVPQLGAFPLPVEVVPFGWEATAKACAGLGCTPARRMAEHQPFVSDNGNYILDCAFGTLAEPATLAARLNAIPGVVENGLFLGMVGKLVIGRPDGTCTLR